MSKGDQWEVWNPFGERIDKLSPTERVEQERGAAWGIYINGGGGDPSHFDYQSWIRGKDRNAAFEEEHARKSQGRSR